MEKPNPERALPKNPTATHSYDGKLAKAKAQLIQEISRVSLAPKGAKMEGFNQLREILRRVSATPSALQCYDIIVATFDKDGRVSRSPNYDPTNDLHADDLLYLCFEQIVLENNLDLTRALISQLEDMRTGLCAQGRTTRLFQILLAYRL